MDRAYMDHYLLCHLLRAKNTKMTADNSYFVESFLIPELWAYMDHYLLCHLLSAKNTKMTADNSYFVESFLIPEL